MCQQDLGCPFLVICGSECYYNSSLYFPSPSFSVPLSHLDDTPVGSTLHFCLYLYCPACSPSSVYMSVFVDIFCRFDFPFNVHYGPTPFALPFLVALLWFGGLDFQGWCAKKASAHQKHIGLQGCGASLSISVVKRLRLALG